eukprot:6174084-Pleurochrysis_carterae.AAC.2
MLSTAPASPCDKARNSLIRESAAVKASDVCRRSRSLSARPKVDASACKERGVRVCRAAEISSDDWRVEQFAVGARASSGGLRTASASFRLTSSVPLFCSLRSVDASVSTRAGGTVRTGRMASRKRPDDFLIEDRKALKRRSPSGIDAMCVLQLLTGRARMAWASHCSRHV